MMVRLSNQVFVSETGLTGSEEKSSPGMIPLLPVKDSSVPEGRDEAAVEPLRRKTKTPEKNSYNQNGLDTFNYTKESLGLYKD